MTAFGIFYDTLLSLSGTRGGLLGIAAAALLLRVEADARAGYYGSPVWTHGGVAFAPKPRDYSYRLNKKVRRLALKSALSAKAAAEEIIVIDDMKMDEIKTKTFAQLLDKIGAGQGKTLVITAGSDANVIKSARNIAGVQTANADVLNPYIVLNNARLVIARDAVAKIEEVYA